jgi:hypothetical protein
MTFIWETDNAYQDEDALSRTVQHFREGIKIVMTIYVPGAGKKTLIVDEEVPTT